MPSKVSIIIPAYNAEKCIYRCLNSVAAQDFADFEAIIINDGSKDATPAILDDFAQKDKRFKIIHRSNGGVSSARNKGLEQSLGRFVTFIDSDDFVEKNYLSALVEGFQNNKAELAVCGYFEHSRYHNKPLPLHDLQSFLPQLVISEDEFQSKLFSGVTGVLWGKLFCREIIERHHLRLNPEISLSEDMVFVLQYSNLIRRIAIIPHNLYHYDRLSESGLSSKKNGSYLKNIELTNLEIARHYKKEDVHEIIERRLRTAVTEVLKTVALGEKSWSQKTVEIKNLLRRYPGLFSKSQNIPIKWVAEDKSGYFMLYNVVLEKLRKIKNRL